MTSVGAAKARNAGFGRSAARGITPLAIALGVGVIGVGTAYAYFTGHGNGGGSASTIAGLPALTTTATAAVGDLLYPGSNSPLSLKINNPGTTAVIVTGVSAGGAITSDRTGCAGTNVTLTPTTGLNISIAPGASVTTSIAHAVSMNATAANACQGATFTIPVTLIGRNP